MEKRENKISELILKLSLSGLPPSFQDHVVNNVGQLSDSRINLFIEILDELNEKEVNYLKSAEKFQKFLNIASDNLKNELKIESDIIKKELMDELSGCEN